MASRRRLKVKAVAYLGGSCIRCGYNKCIDALEFHHRDPELKTAQIGRYLWVIHTPEALAEIAKCDLVCANCHRERTLARSSNLVGCDPLKVVIYE